MQYLKQKRNPTSVTRKVLAGFSLAFIAIFLAYSITKYGFNDMLTTVEELSEPNVKLNMLHHVFEEINAMDQMQRADAIKNPEKPFAAFLEQSQSIMSMIDTLLLMEWQPGQSNRIASMKNILKERDERFLSYLKQKSKSIDNKILTRKIDTLSTIIEQKKIEVDSNVITTQKKTTTTYLRDSIEEKAKNEKSFIGRLFSKKKKEIAEDTMKVRVKEELSVIVDTVSIARQNKALDEVEKIMQTLESDQRTQTKKLIEQELELIRANSQFNNQLLGVLHDVEEQELQVMKNKSAAAGNLVNESISRISILLMVFFLGAALLVYLIWIDVSKSNYYKIQLEQARDEAEELSKIKQRFLANMSHEIRTPLQSIIGFAEQIKDTSSNEHEAIEAIHSSSEHLLHIVNEVLDYSRISSGNFTFDKSEFKLLDIVKEVEGAMHIQAERKKLDLILDLEQVNNMQLLGDAFRLRQILYNILGNAIKFTTKGFVKLTVRTKEEPTHVNCHFEITDTGIGIRKEDIAKIFNQFEQANSSIAGQFGGTGLGLTIVKSLIEAQGGNLRVTSEPGKGSTFSIDLSYSKNTEGVKPVSSSATSLLPAAEFTGKVIMVDDDTTILKLCGLIMKKHHVEHMLYSDPETLLYADPDQEVTHIFMDIRMPRMNGLDLCKALKNKYPVTTKFIALTAHVFEQEKNELYASGFDIVLSKPFHERGLLNVLGISGEKQPVKPQQLAIDLSALREMTLNDEDLFQTVIKQFINETQNDITRLNDELSTMNKSATRETIHKLAGRTGQMGISPISLKLRDLENKIVQGQDFAELHDAIVSVKKEVQLIVETIQETTAAKSV